MIIGRNSVVKLLYLSAMSKKFYLSTDVLKVLETNVFDDAKVLEFENSSGDEYYARVYVITDDDFMTSILAYIWPKLVETK